MSILSFKVPYWYDLHMHARQGPAVPDFLKDHAKMGCCGILAMPNTLPPIVNVWSSSSTDVWSIETYQAMLQKDNLFETVIVPLYLSQQTTAEMIEAGAKSGLLKSVKYYPPHGTTNSASGVPMDDMIGSNVFKAMEETGVILNIHGEQHGMIPEDYFDRTTNAEEVFYGNVMPKLVEAHPNLRIVCEHITTAVAVDFVKQASNNVAATITPQHLLYTIGHLLQGLRYHLYCMPLVKYKEDRNALREVATSGHPKFFAGTDSAPHTTKCTPCGCAAGCYTGGIAPQLYVQAFEEAGLDMTLVAKQMKFRSFLSLNGPNFYEFPRAEKTFTLIKKPQTVDTLQTKGGMVTPLPVGRNPNHDTDGTTIPWSLEL